MVACMFHYTNMYCTVSYVVDRAHNIGSSEIYKTVTHDSKTIDDILYGKSEARLTQWFACTCNCRMYFSGKPLYIYYLSFVWLVSCCNSQ